MSIVMFGALILLIVMGVPIAVALTGAALAALFTTDVSALVVVQRYFTSMDSFSLMAIPFFMMAGLLMERGGISKRLINLANLLLGNMYGGLAIVLIIVSAFFGALTGSSAATVAAIGGIMIPSMIKQGYDERFTLATSASNGYLGRHHSAQYPYDYLWSGNRRIHWRNVYGGYRSRNPSGTGNVCLCAL